MDGRAGRHLCVMILFWCFSQYSLQPGCYTILCAHARAYEYYAESVLPGHEHNLMATRCNSFSSFKNGKCSGSPIPMGLNTPNTARGNYYLQTNKAAPFGRKSKILGYIKEVSNHTNVMY